jgi:hypothetical protein
MTIMEVETTTLGLNVKIYYVQYATEIIKIQVLLSFIVVIKSVAIVFMKWKYVSIDAHKN